MERNVPIFVCNGHFNNPTNTYCNDQSYLKRNQIKYLLDKHVDYSKFWESDESVQVYGISFSISSYVEQQLLSHMFLMTKKYFNKLRSATFLSGQSQWNRNEVNFFSIRHEICSFLTILKRYLHISHLHINHLHTSQLQSTNFQSYLNQCQQILQELKSLLLFINRISLVDIELFLLEGCVEVNSPIYNFVHIYYDIWWSTTELIFLIHHNTQGELKDFSLIREELCSDSLFQIIKLILTDIIYMFYKKFDKLSLKERLSSCGFFCLCTREMLIMAKLLLDFPNENKFLPLFNQVIKLIKISKHSSSTLNDFNLNSYVNIPDKISLFLLWLIPSMSNIYNFDVCGNYNNSIFESTNSLFIKYVNELLKENEDNLNENELSTGLLLCLKWIDNLDPGTEILLNFTEFFTKKLNHQFFTNDKIDNILKPSVCWIDDVRQYYKINYSLYRGETSLNLYYSLLSTQLVRLFNHPNDKFINHQWQKFKGKFFVNLQLKKLEKLNETGFYNLLTLFLILIDLSNEKSFEIIDKSIVILEDFIAKNNTFRTFQLSWKFIFFILDQKDSPSYKVKAHNLIVKQFNKLFDEWNTKSTVNFPRIRNKFTYIGDFCKNSLDSEKCLIILDLSLDKMQCEKNDFFQILAKIILDKLTISLDMMSRKNLLMPIFSDFIEKNLPDRSKVNKIFYVMDFILKVCPELIDGLIGELTRKIEAFEKNRNLGYDLQLRKQLQDFLKKHCND